VVANATAPIANGTSVAEASANIDKPIRNLAEAQGKQAVAYGIDLPNRSSLDPLFSQNQKVSTSITPDKTVLGYGVLGGTASIDPSFNSSIYYSVNISGISNPQHLFVGLLDNSFTGPGFDSLEFSISASGQQLFDQTFNPTQAQGFFDDKILDLGLLTDITEGGTNLELIFVSTLTGSNNSGFYFNFVFADPTKSVRVADTTVPLPPSVFLLGSGLLGLGAVGWWRKGS
jgi:hypothetical protein